MLPPVVAFRLGKSPWRNFEVGDSLPHLSLFIVRRAQGQVTAATGTCGYIKKLREHPIFPRILNRPTRLTRSKAFVMSVKGMYSTWLSVFVPCTSPGVAREEKIMSILERSDLRPSEIWAHLRLEVSRFTSLAGFCIASSALHEQCMHYLPSQQSTTAVWAADGTSIPYLRCTVSNILSPEAHEINRRIRPSIHNTGQADDRSESGRTPQVDGPHKMAIYRVCVPSTLLYGNETYVPFTPDNGDTLIHSICTTSGASGGKTDSPSHIKTSHVDVAGLPMWTGQPYGTLCLTRSDLLRLSHNSKQF